MALLFQRSGKLWPLSSSSSSSRSMHFQLQQEVLCKEVFDNFWWYAPYRMSFLDVFHFHILAVFLVNAVFPLLWPPRQIIDRSWVFPVCSVRRERVPAVSLAAGVQSITVALCTGGWLTVSVRVARTLLRHTDCKWGVQQFEMISGKQHPVQNVHMIAWKRPQKIFGM